MVDEVRCVTLHFAAFPVPVITTRRHCACY